LVILCNLFPKIAKNSAQAVATLIGRLSTVDVVVVERSDSVSSKDKESGECVGAEMVAHCAAKQPLTCG
jgi:hypothetical protein